MRKNTSQQIQEDLTALCVRIGERHPGSQNNQKATAYVSERLQAAGFEPVQTELDCLDWEAGEITLLIGEQPVNAFVGPYSNSIQISSHFKTASCLEELAAAEVQGMILVLHGELCREQLAAKNFVFYNPEHHQKIIALLEGKNPSAIIAITGKNPATTGALSPFPLIEDGDFDIPSVYISEQEGMKILEQPGKEIYLQMDSKRIPSKAFNVSGYKRGQTTEKILLCAHIDTKKGTPGAIDNAGGVCLLLSMADVLKDYQGRLSIEILVINGEDYYAYPGGMRYLADHQQRFDQIRLVINSDGAGSKGSRTSYCLFNAGEEMTQLFKEAFQDESKFLETQPWYQSDHAMFAVHGVTAAALTTEDFTEIWSSIAHTEKDTVDLVDADILAEAVWAIKELIEALNQLQ